MDIKNEVDRYLIKEESFIDIFKDFWRDLKYVGEYNNTIIKFVEDEGSKVLKLKKTITADKYKDAVDDLKKKVADKIDSLPMPSSVREDSKKKINKIIDKKM